MINYYICIGLGVFLALSAVDKANPNADLSPVMTVLMFVATLFIWPFTIIANYMMSNRIRKMEAELDTLMRGMLDGTHKPGPDLRIVENNDEETNDSDSNGA